MLQHLPEELIGHTISLLAEIEHDNCRKRTRDQRDHLPIWHPIPILAGSSLLSLSLTSHAFHRLVTPLFHSDIVIIATSYSAPSNAHTLGLARRTVQALMHSANAPFIRSLGIESADTWNEEMIAIVISLLRTVPNLQMLDVTESLFPVDQALLLAIESHSTLLTVKCAVLLDRKDAQLSDEDLDSQSMRKFRCREWLISKPHDADSAGSWTRKGLSFTSLHISHRAGSSWKDINANSISTLSVNNYEFIDAFVERHPSLQTIDVDPSLKLIGLHPSSGIISTLNLSWLSSVCDAAPGMNWTTASVNTISHSRSTFGGLNWYCSALRLSARVELPQLISIIHGTTHAAPRLESLAVSAPTRYITGPFADLYCENYLTFINDTALYKLSHLKTLIIDNLHFAEPVSNAKPKPLQENEALQTIAWQKFVYHLALLLPALEWVQCERQIDGGGTIGTVPRLYRYEVLRDAAHFTLRVRAKRLEWLGIDADIGIWPPNPS